MAIDAATVRRVAHLARIKTPEDRLEPLAAELNGILAWIEQLNEVDVTGVEPMTSNVAQPLRLGMERVTARGPTGDSLPLPTRTVGDPVQVLVVRRGDRDVSHFVLALDTHDVDRAEQAASVADCLGKAGVFVLTVGLAPANQPGQSVQFDFLALAISEKIWLHAIQVQALV
mgnify:CR=1 FL=1